jgi:hypothetical protein
MKINNKALIIFTSLCLISSKGFSLPLNPPIENANSPTSILQGLNKVTGKTSDLKIKVGGEMDFGKLTIKVEKCWRAPLYQRPENKILLKIEENISNKDSENRIFSEDGSEKINQENGPKKTIFYGWMFSSSPSISGLEHPIYDITAIECKN